jgi:ABC-type nitrate/sulfonate/bicarbonate transport system permease component
MIDFNFVATGGLTMPPVARALIQAAIGLVLIIAFWAIAATLTEPFILPSPGAVVGKALSLFASKEFRGHIGSSGVTFLTGFIPAAIVAIILGFAAAISQIARWIVGAVVIGPAAAPLIAFAAPLALWLGLSADSKITLVFLVTAFAMANRFIGAYRHTGFYPAGTQAATSALGLPPRFEQRIAVAILSSMRLGIMLGVGAVVVGEMFASTQGLGYLMMNYAARLDTPGLMTVLVVVLVPTALAGVILQGVEEAITGRTRLPEADVVVRSWDRL